MRLIILLASACLALTAVAAEDKKIVCYLGTWATYRTGAGKFDAEDIDASLCTHAIYTFVGVGDDYKIKSLDAWQDFADGGGKNGLARFNALKKKNSALKTLVAVGGWTESSPRFSKMAATASSRKVFVNSVIAFLKQHKFDGFDMDWEYPAQREGSSPQDRENFIALLKDLSVAFKKDGFLLSAAVGAGEGTASQSYNIKEMNKYLDFINLMSYDFHGAYDGKTGMNAGLYGAKSESDDDKKRTVDAAVKYWLKNGASKEKLILGTPMYGRTFTLTNNGKTSVGSPATGPGTAGPYTKEAGMLGYNEICEKLKGNGWTVKWDEERRVPYAYSGNQWVSYDDIESIKEKAKYAKEVGLGGVMIWSIETDDFKGNCGEAYPLLKTLNHVIRGTKEVTNHKPLSPKLSPKNLSIESSPVEEKEDEEEEEEDEEDTNDTANVDDGEKRPSSNGVCHQAGPTKHPTDETKFIQCVAADGDTFVEYEMQCPSDLIWDAENSTCNYRTQ